MNICQVWQGAARVMSGRDKRGSVLLVSRWKDAAFDKQNKQKRKLNILGVHISQDTMIWQKFF